VSRRTGTATFEALGTTAQATVTAPELLDDAVSMVLGELRAIDETYSRFREDSELARLQRAEGSPMVASPLLQEALTVAVHAAATSGGAVDPTVGAALSGLGWDLDFAVVAVRQGPTRILFRPAAG
jgi:thiamine biosynthesis lipoprotein